MLATAFSILHFRKFLEVHGPVPDSIASRLIKLNDDPSPEAMKSLEGSDEYIPFPWLQNMVAVLDDVCQS